MFHIQFVQAKLTLLVRFSTTLWVADLSHQVVLLVEDVVADAAQVSPLHIGIQIDLHDTV